jgi:hypothetical protein
MAVAVLFLIVYFNGAQPLLTPTAHQSLQNQGFFLFLLYTAVIVGISVISYQTQSFITFFSLLTGISLVWLIFGKKWAYTPM